MKHKNEQRQDPAAGGDPEVNPAPDAPVETASAADGAPDAAAEAPAAATEPEPSEADKLRDRLLRLQADFDNYRKRVARDHGEMVKRANEDLVEAILPVLDHFGHAEASMEKDVRSDIAAYLEGFRLVRDELVRVLDSFGVKPIESAGAVFDATRHEAVAIMPSETAEPGTVLFESRKGYLLHGRVLRPSQVIVAADREAAPDAAPANAAGVEA